MYIRNETVTSQKPYAEIRHALVESIRNSDKPAEVKNAAEVLIGCIDAGGTQDAFLQAYRVFYRAVHRVPLPAGLEPGEIAEHLGLLDRGDLQ